MMNTWNPMISSYHSKARSTQNKGVTLLFCLGHGLQCYFLIQARNQKFFKAEEVLWNQGTSITISSKTHERKALLGNLVEFFLQDTDKTTFRMKNLTQKMDTIRIFFQIQHFLVFLKRTGQELCFSLSFAIQYFVYKNAIAVLHFFIKTFHLQKS